MEGLLGGGVVGIVGATLFVFYRMVKYMINTLVVGLRTRVEELEKHLHEAESRIHTLETYIIHDLGKPLPNGD